MLANEGPTSLLFRRNSVLNIKPVICVVYSMVTCVHGVFSRGAAFGIGALVHCFLLFAMTRTNH